MGTRTDWGSCSRWPLLQQRSGKEDHLFRARMRMRHQIWRNSVGTFLFLERKWIRSSEMPKTQRYLGTRYLRRDEETEFKNIGSSCCPKSSVDMQPTQIHNWRTVCAWVRLKATVKSTPLERTGCHECWDPGNLKMSDTVKSRDNWGRGVVTGATPKVN